MLFQLYNKINIEMVIYYLEGRSVDICHGNVDFRRVHFAITADKYIVSYKQTGRREDGETEDMDGGKLSGREGRVGRTEGWRKGRGKVGKGEGGTDADRGR